MHTVTAIHIVITGRVQGVGFRDWLVRDARQRGVSGWVRNLGHEKVEAVLSGAHDAVAACLAACRQGPPLAHVQNIVTSPDTAPTEPGFVRRPSMPE